MNKKMARRSLVVFLAAIMLYCSLNLFAWADMDTGASREEIYVSDTFELNGVLEDPLLVKELVDVPHTMAAPEENPIPEEPDGDGSEEPTPEQSEEPAPEELGPVPKERFQIGYGVVAGGAKLYKKPNQKNPLGSFKGKGMVYVVEMVEDDGDWLHAFFAIQMDDGPRMIGGYVNAKYVEPLDAETALNETYNLQEEATVCYYDEHNTLPLAVLSFVWEETNPVPEDTQEGEESSDDEPGDGQLEENSPADNEPENELEEAPLYDPQPQTMEDVQIAIDAYELEYGMALDTASPEAALEVEKAHWQHQVADEIMPEGYFCGLVENDERFSAIYFTFFAEGELEDEDEQPEEEPVETPLYDPQPQTMEEVQAAIDAYELEYYAVLKAEGFLAALSVRKPHWQFEVPSELMPAGYRCELVDYDEDFGADYYTFFADDSQTIEYDPQPQTMEEVQAAIDAYELEYYAVLEEHGFLAALTVRKPHWQYEVPEVLMPSEYRCELVDYDEDFGAEYYTFFPSPVTTGFGASGYKVEPPEGPDISNMFTHIGQAVRDPDYANVARITVDAGNKQGIIWFNTKLDLCCEFSTRMYLYLGHKDPLPRGTGSEPPADGVTFTMHNDERGSSAIGGFGEGLGVYRGRAAGEFGDGRHIENALVVELDTYRNDGSGKGPVVDPDIGPHCAVVIPKRGSTDAEDKITIADHIQPFPFTVVQDWVLFQVSWIPMYSNGILGGMLVYTFDGTRRTFEINNVEKVFNGTSVWWGFSGSTGGQTALQAAAIVWLPSTDPEPPALVDFSFVKVDAENDAILLKDAIFNLYACTVNGAHTHDEFATTGSCWFGGETYQAASDPNGRVTFEGLAPGVYQLVEVAAPNGYQVPLGQWRFSINESGEVFFDSLSGPKPPAFKNIGTAEAPAYQVGNVKRFNLPVTGGPGVFPIMALGVHLMLGGIILLMVIARRTLRNKEVAL